MNLYNIDYRIKAINSGKEAELEYIIKLFLIETKKKNRTNKFGTQYLEENTLCILTVPAVWDLK